MAGASSVEGTRGTWRANSPRLGSGSDTDDRHEDLPRASLLRAGLSVTDSSEPSESMGWHSAVTTLTLLQIAFTPHRRFGLTPPIRNRSFASNRCWRSEPTPASGGVPDLCERRWQCRPCDQFCIVPGTSAPRSISSRSVTVTVLPFDFTSHQNATASSSFQALLSSRSRPVHHTSRKRRASVSLGHRARSARSASVSAIHS